MKIAVHIAGNQVLLTTEVWEQLLDLIDGAEIMHENYKGKGKGFFGRDKEYELEFQPFDAAHHAHTVRILTERQIDTYKTIIAMREHPMP
jgi:hypothetical protein